jgi:parallel beta-helix repeat protein
VNAGTAHDPILITVDNISSDHSGIKAVSFENGSSATLRNAFITATKTSSPAVDVGPNFGGGVEILSNHIGNNGNGSGITIESNDVLVEGNRLTQNRIGIVLLSTVTGGIKIIGNQIGALGKGGQPTGIDLSAVPANSDWFTIVGNSFEGTATPISFPTFRIRLGVHSRITNNPGYNPADPNIYSPPPVPNSGTAQLNIFFADATVVITPGSATITLVQLTSPGGTVTTYLSGSFTGSGRIQVFVPCGYAITLTFSPATPKPTWTWFPT